MIIGFDMFYLNCPENDDAPCQGCMRPLAGMGFSLAKTCATGWRLTLTISEEYISVWRWTSLTEVEKEPTADECLSPYEPYL